jgi:predicted ATPase
MINEIRLTNFKCFNQLELPVKSLTVLTGANGVGKSTVLQSILLLHQSSWLAPGRGGRLQLDGELVELGHGQDVLFKRSESDSFEITLLGGTESPWLEGADEKSEPFFKATVEVTSDEVRKNLPANVKSNSTIIDSLRRRISYLSADRLGPRTAYAIGRESARNQIGRCGEFAPMLFQRNRSRKIANSVVLLESAEKVKHPSVEVQLGLWMSRLFPGFEVKADLIDRIDAVTLGYSLHQQIGEPVLMRPINVGFGVSVAFPVILAGLLARRGTTLIVENPEAHLHPSAQSILGEFLARVSAGGVQVFVETHSEHIVNGIRIAVKNGVITPSDVAFCAFLRGVEFGSHRVELVGIDQSGEFDSQPNQFFDQADLDLKLIYGV